MFGAELNQIPMLQKQLAEIAGIPSKLDKLIDRIEHSNSVLASSVSGTMTRTAKDLASISSHNGSSPYAMPQVLPGWMKWTIVVSVILIALACISNTAHNIWFTESKASTDTTAAKTEVKNVETNTGSVKDPSVNIKRAQAQDTIQP